LNHAELGEILAAIQEQSFRDFVTAMIETGCRPSEVARVSAVEVDLQLGVWVFTTTGVSATSCM
jgi:integrase